MSTQISAERSKGDSGDAPRPTVGVVVPCHDYAEYLEACVRSALDQEGVLVEVVVVDDASNDGSLDVARSMAAADPRVRVLANERNLGPVATFNRGLEAVGGEFLVRLDADDLLAPGALRRAVDVFRAEPSVGLVYGHPLHFTGEPAEHARPGDGGWICWPGRAWLAARCAAGDNVITSPEAVMRRSVVDEVGGQRDLAHTHDMEMWLRISTRADVAYLTGADQAHHREHDRSLSRSAADPTVILRELRDAFAVLFAGLADDPQTPALHGRARRAVASQALDYARSGLDRGVAGEREDALISLAVEIDPTISGTATWRAAARARRRSSALPTPLAALIGLPERWRRRRRYRRRFAHWSRTGVYERVPGARIRRSEQSR